MVKKRRTKRLKRLKPAGIGAQEPAAPRNRKNNLARHFAAVERSITGKVPAEPARSRQELEERLSQYVARERLAWLRRPRLHTAIFSQALLDDELAKLGVKPAGDKAQKEAAERAQQVSAIARKHHWSDERLASFKQAVVDYRQKPTIDAYLRVRQQFPEIEILIGELAGIDPLFVLAEEFQKQGIDRQLVASCLDADEPSIDALCLHLIEKIVEREKISKDEPGHIQKRRAAISDAMVNYLIVTILESCDWNDQEVRIPASLVVLIRHQLFGSKRPDLHTAYLSKERLHNLAMMIAQELKPNERLSINKLASIAFIPRSTAARWLRDKEFMEWLETAQKWVAEGLFKNVRK
jgi:hypothetical protein